MKNYGKVTEYNGFYGKIKDNLGNDYVLLKKNLVDKQIKENDIVIFEEEKIQTPELEMNVARFVKKLKR